LATDLVLIHPPAVFDFRERPTLTGLLSDLVPPSAAFEMYPLGFTSIGHYLEKHGLRVRILNLAYRMLTEPGLDVDRVLGGLRARAFGVDLHWLAHADGALELAGRLKRLHPEVPVILGGISASYYHREAAAYPEVDFVVRGDCTEEPLRVLLLALRGRGRLEDVPNLTWKRNGEVIANPLTHVPGDLDYVDMPSYRFAIKAALRGLGLRDVIPYLGWLQRPMVAVLTSRGCARNCHYCGGSAFSYRQVMGRGRPAFRSPERLVQDMRFLARFTRAPIYILHDIRQGGTAYARELLDRLGRARIPNQIIFELFDPAGPDFIRALARATASFGLEVALESSDEGVRRRNGKFTCSNQEVEETIVQGLALGARTVHVYFMIGLAGQTRGHVMGDLELCRRLLALGRGRLSAFVAPLAPFLDPGSPAFEDPEHYGYRIFRRTLAEHRAALREPTWKQALNYETSALTRGDIVDLTYRTALELAHLKYEAGLFDRQSVERVVAGVEHSRRVVALADHALDLDGPEQAQALARLAEELRTPQEPLLRGAGELNWPVPGWWRGVGGLAWGALSALVAGGKAPAR
jgi:B12-binding domain/radical SAM domain protein